MLTPFGAYYKDFPTKAATTRYRKRLDLEEIYERDAEGNKILDTIIQKPVNYHIELKTISGELSSGAVHKKYTSKKRSLKMLDKLVVNLVNGTSCYASIKKGGLINCQKGRNSGRFETYKLNSFKAFKES